MRVGGLTAQHPHDAGSLRCIVPRKWFVGGAGKSLQAGLSFIAFQLTVVGPRAPGYIVHEMHDRNELEAEDYRYAAL
jgi:hypothetical protein